MLYMKEFFHKNRNKISEVIYGAIIGGLCGIFGGHYLAWAWLWYPPLFIAFVFFRLKRRNTWMVSFLVMTGIVIGLLMYVVIEILKELCWLSV